MTSSSRGSAVDLRAASISCCDVTTAVHREMMLKSISTSRSAHESVDKFMSDAHATVTSSGSGAFTSSADSNGGLSRDSATQSITTDTGSDVSDARQTVLTTSASSQPTNKSAVQSLAVTGSHQITRDAGGLPTWSRTVTLTDVNISSTSSSVVTSRLTETFTDISLADYQTSFSNTSRDHRDPRLPLALRSSADNASMSAAVGSNTANRRAGSGLLREEVATVGAAVAGVVVFWSLLAFTMCAIVRMRKRKQRRRLRGNDVDAQTAMMEAMVRAELARGRSRVSDSRVPTYVNVAELLPRSSSSCDVDMSELFHYVFDNNHSDLHGVWKKQRYNDVVFGRSRDHAARWQDGSRTIQPAREAMYLSTAHNCRQMNSRDDHYRLLNDAKDMANGDSNQLACNGLLTRVKSLDSVCKAAEEPTVETKHRQRPRRRRRSGVRRSASTSRCLVSANSKPASSVDAPANGDVTKSDKDVTVDDDVRCQLPDSDVTPSAECVDQTPQPDIKDQPAATEPVDVTPTPEVARHGDRIALPEVSSLGDREPAVMSPPSQQNMFSSRTCALVPTQRCGPQPLHRHIPPYRLITSAACQPCSDRTPRLLRYPPPPPPPPPLPGHVMRLFSTSSDTKSPCSRPNASVAGTAGRPFRFPRMGHTGLSATNSSQRMTLQVVRPEHVQL